MAYYPLHNLAQGVGSALGLDLEDRGLGSQNRVPFKFLRDPFMRDVATNYLGDVSTIIAKGGERFEGEDIIFLEYVEIPLAGDGSVGCLHAQSTTDAVYVARGSLIDQVVLQRENIILDSPVRTLFRGYEPEPSEVSQFWSELEAFTIRALGCAPNLRIPKSIKDVEQ